MKDTNTGKLDDMVPIEVAPRIWWVGFADYEAGFSNNPYLLIEDDRAVLFDPGPGHPIFRDVITYKIRQVIPLEKIYFIVVHHQDPDLCGLIPYLEPMLHPEAVLIAHPRTALFLPYYGVRRNILPVGDEDVLELSSKRRLRFYHAPYLHFAGNMLTYDKATGTLFSSDIFATFNRNWHLYADEAHLPLVRGFLEQYVGSIEPLLYIYERLKGLRIERILPQHGGIIEGSDQVERFLEVLKEVHPGRLLWELQNRPSKDQERIIIEAGRKWLEVWLKEPVRADTLEALMNRALQKGPATVALLIENVGQEAERLGVANPLTFGNVHRYGEIRTTRATGTLQTLRRRFLSRQYGMRTEEGEADNILQYGLLSIRVHLGVMFIDIRGFTSWSVHRDPAEIVKTLSQEHELITRTITAYGGRVNKLLGDGILAYFPTEELTGGVQAAAEIHRVIAENGLLPVGIGGDFGEVTLGDIGEETRLDYTLIGAPVNFASRMCDSADAGQTALTKRWFESLPSALRERLRRLRTFEQITVQAKFGDPILEGVRFIAEGLERDDLFTHHG